ncbi:hypothetical protein [uncultured Microbacterium sp.]|uniref:hypothetical protein n=1 Tax=uncultured Microbacterium sp. TaxID=191216 RepID=UPI0035CA23B5
MRIIHRRATGSLVAIATIVLSLTAVAGSAHAAPLHRTPPPPAPVATSAPAPAPAPIAVTGTVTHLGSNFSAGGYIPVTYSVKTVTAGTYAVRYTVNEAGGGVNTTVDGVSLNQVLVAAGKPVTTSTFRLSAGTHTITTQSPDGYGETSIDLVRVG